MASKANPELAHRIADVIETATGTNLGELAVSPNPIYVGIEPGTALEAAVKKAGLAIQPMLDAGLAVAVSSSDQGDNGSHWKYAFDVNAINTQRGYKAPAKPVTVEM